METLHAFFHLTVSFRQTSMLALMLGPGVHNEGLDEAAWFSCVAKQVPVEGAIASFDLT